MLSKTANAAYKEYKLAGGTLSFQEFLDREKRKFINADGKQDSLLLVNRNLNDSVQTAIKQTLERGGLKTQESGKTIFGINKKILIGSTVVLVAVIGFVIYKKTRT